MTIHQAYRQLMYKLYELYSDRESAQISDMVIENVTNQRRIDRIVHQSMPLSLTQEEQLGRYTELLLHHMPVQYVLQEAWFAGMRFFVDDSVLIPRPETEELVEWIVDLWHERGNIKHLNSNILDIGTGSGCIAIALKKKLETISMHGADISLKALETAQKNAKANDTEIHFFVADILDKNTWDTFPFVDVIVSNPPYIKQNEAGGMDANVIRYEPQVALFVPDEDPLLFYKKIADFGLKKLLKTGKVFFEINESLAVEVYQILSEAGYKNIIVKKDLQGKNRMVTAEICWAC